MNISPHCVWLPVCGLVTAWLVCSAHPTKASPPVFLEETTQNRATLTEAPPTIRLAQATLAEEQTEDEEPVEDDLLHLSLEEISRQQIRFPSLEQEVTTVARRPSTIGRSPTAVFVVTDEMIRRSGATTIAEALRLVPGLNVARIDSNKWAISSRGDNQRFANKMLVQIDGRTVYTQVFSGTYWDVQNVVLEDVDRIEVIRGPGATVWGATAVNGVVNIITKNSQETGGVYAKTGGGTEERGFSTARVGGSQGDLSWRAYGKWFDRGPQATIGSAVEADDWQMGSGGFRMDWSPQEGDLWTLQGDAYEGNTGTNAIFSAPYDDDLAGSNILTRWTHTIDDDRDYTVQLYYDAYRRDSPSLFQYLETFDVDFQSHLRLGCFHEITWGLGYRRIHDFLPKGSPGSPLSFVPSTLTTNLYSGFVQDEITLREDEWFLTVGAKLLKNAFSGFEVQPTIRLLWVVDERRVAWGAVSRAVRTPARYDRDSRLVSGPNLIGPSANVGSEELLAYELGFRTQATDNFFWDAALYYNVYEDLRSTNNIGGNQYVFANDMAGDILGCEVSGTFEISPCWQLQGWYAFSKAYATELLNPTYPKAEDFEGNSPVHQAFLMSSWDIDCNVEFDVMARYVDHLPQATTPSYISLDMRLGWRPTPRLEFSVVGQNLLDDQHKEFGGGGGDPQYVSEIRRGVYGQAVYRY